eukprot:jgi/Tetstr1/463426/TSEL_000730.t1
MDNRCPSSKFTDQDVTSSMAALTDQSMSRATWEAQFQLAAWNELGRGWRLSNAAKSFKLCGFPSAPLASWVNDIVKKCRELSMEAWNREYSSVKYYERGGSEKPGVGRLVRGYVFLTMRAMELLFGLHNVRHGGKDVGYGNIKRRENSLKLAAVPPATHARGDGGAAAQRSCVDRVGLHL